MHRTAKIRSDMTAWLLGALASLLLMPGAMAQEAQADPAALYEVVVQPAPVATPAPMAEDAAPAAAEPTAQTGPVDVVASTPAEPAPAQAAPAAGTTTAPASAAATQAGAATAATGAAGVDATATHKKDDLIGAAEGVFGKGAKGLAELIEKIMKDQGEPNAYIAGREASGAFLVGLRYGSGTMVHTVEGQRPVYWTGPSLGLDFGGDAAKTFVLVYNLHDSQDLYERFGQIEGRAYFIGGLSATYLQRGDVIVVPIRMGVGMRLGANVGYMKFSEKAKWLPF